MPFNLPGILVPFHLIFNPRLVIPGLLVKDIRQLDFVALKEAGYRGAVFDKDNCLTIPHRDTLVPELQESWKKCKEIFGDGNVLIVSNSAGTHLDAGGLQSESVMHHLGVPVLRHKSMKPAYSCIAAIRTYFASLRSPVMDHELIVVGDRIFTDIVMANRMRTPSRVQSSPAVDEKQVIHVQQHHLSGLSGRPLAIWTTGVWHRESMFMRWMEHQLVNSVRKWSTALPGEHSDTGRFVKKLPDVQSPQKPHMFSIHRLSSLLRRA